MIGSGLTALYLKKKYADIADENIDAMYNTYTRTLDLMKAKYEREDEDKEKVEETIVRVSDVDDHVVAHLAEKHRTAEKELFDNNDYVDLVGEVSEPDQDIYEKDVHYIDQDLYFDDDDRDKLQIDILSDDGDFWFLLNGQRIEDWPDRIGPDILFHVLVSPGDDRVIYVRNNLRNEDYEVSWELP